LTDSALFTPINEQAILVNRFISTLDRDSIVMNVSLFDTDDEKETRLFSKVGHSDVTDDKQFLVIDSVSRNATESDLYEIIGLAVKRIGYCPRNQFEYSLLSDKNKTKLTLSSCGLSCNSIIKYDHVSDKSDTIYSDSTLALYSVEATYHPNYVFVKAYTNREYDSLHSILNFYRRSTYEELKSLGRSYHFLTYEDVDFGYQAKWRLLNIKTRKMIDIDLHAYYPYMSKDQKSVLFIVHDGSADKVYDEKWRVISLEDMINDEK
jgi:hypothetical protein